MAAGAAATRGTSDRPLKVAKLDESASVIVQLVSPQGESIGSQLQLPHRTTPKQLETLLNSLLGNEEPGPYAFFIDDTEVAAEIGSIMLQLNKSVESAVRVVFQPQAVFRVRSVGRCTATLTGHTEAVLSAHFSPDGRQLATGSGDATVRFWDLQTQLPLRDGQAHKAWVMAVAWSPDAGMLVSGDKDGVLHLWSPRSGESTGACRGHTKWITALAWEPAHRAVPCRRFTSASRDGTVRVWDAVTRQQLLCMAGHMNTVNCVRWAGDGTIISASNDREIRVWNSDDGRTVRVLTGHAHWVNSLALSSEFVLRTGPFDHTGVVPKDAEGMRAVRHPHGPPFAACKMCLCESYGDVMPHDAAQKRYDDLLKGEPERLVSGSDDHTLFLWIPSRDKKPQVRLTGHQQLINHVQFSPDGRWLISASFDKAIKLWDGVTGKFVITLRGHVGPVYQVAWSSDSRMFVSGSKDSTLKVWDLRTRKLKEELPGHADEVFAVDWSPDGSTVASGGKDRVVKLWRH